MPLDYDKMPARWSSSTNRSDVSEITSYKVEVEWNFNA
jgi:hypothetical protein